MKCRCAGCLPVPVFFDKLTIQFQCSLFQCPLVLVFTAAFTFFSITRSIILSLALSVPNYTKAFKEPIGTKFSCLFSLKTKNLFSDFLPPKCCFIFIFLSFFGGCLFKCIFVCFFVCFELGSHYVA